MASSSCTSARVLLSTVRRSINDKAELQGVRMPAAWLSERGVGEPREVYAAAGSDIASRLLPQLRTGYTQISPPPEDTIGPAGPPPQIPIVFIGNVTVDGQPALPGARLYAKVSKEGRPTLWFTRQVADPGEYDLPISLNVATYLGATIEFWMDAEAALVTAEVTRKDNNTHSLDLAF